MQVELRAIDRHFARFLTSGTGSPSWVEAVVALASSALGDGHVCLDLGSIAGSTIAIDGGEEPIPPIELLTETLARCPFVGGAEEHLPLVLDGNRRLYLHRYHRYEREVAGAILARSRVQVPVNEELLREGMGRVFPERSGEGNDWQRVAAVAAVRKRVAVISGGPGTGKTSTVVRILALLLEQAGEAPLRIALAAPTGKAAARLKESIAALKAGLACTESVRGRIPERVLTIHSLLGARSGSIHFRHDARNPLPFEVLIVDEASMVALPLMAKLCRALAPEARLILLGDRDQLASVEAGAVLGDICGSGREARFSHDFAGCALRTAGEAITSTTEPSPLSDSLVILRRTYRFGDTSGIGRLASAIREGEGETALDLCRGGGYGDVTWNDMPAGEGLRKALADEVASGYGACLATADPAEALDLLDRFRLLCVLRQGTFGVTGLNQLVEAVLAGRGLIDSGRRWYRGRPLMITVNDHQLKLYNGDVGMILPDPGANGRMRAWFRSPDGTLRSLSPLRLPPHETAWCMTVHKSQGSEFGRVVLLLPPRDQELITRELLYTGITRARKSVALWGDPAGFVAAVSRRVQRASGLEGRLWGETARTEETDIALPSVADRDEGAAVISVENRV